MFNSLAIVRFVVASGAAVHCCGISSAQEAAAVLTRAADTMGGMN